MITQSHVSRNLLVPSNCLSYVTGGEIVRYSQCPFIHYNYRSSSSPHETTFNWVCFLGFHFADLLDRRAQDLIYCMPRIYFL